MPRVRKSLGEIALRVNDLDRMKDFYQEVIDLELIRESTSNVFFKIEEGLSGHTQVLALFDRQDRETDLPPDARQSTIDHIAFSVSKQDFEREKQRLLDLGLKLTDAYHQWVNWRSLYLSDPEGNTVEFVCYDAEPTSLN